MSQEAETVSGPQSMMTRGMMHLKKMIRGRMHLRKITYAIAHPVSIQYVSEDVY